MVQTPWFPTCEKYDVSNFKLCSSKVKDEEACQLPLSKMSELWPTGETKNTFFLYIGGVIGLFYLVAVMIGFLQRRCQPIVVPLTNPEEHERMHEYIFVVKTSLLPYSGCPSTTKVFVQLHGQFHNSTFFHLKKMSATKDILTRGSTDIFVIHTSEDLGEITAVGIELINEIGVKSVWRPSHLEVYSPELCMLWSSDDYIPKMLCVQNLEAHVTLTACEITAKTFRDKGVKYLSNLCVQHQWLSMALCSVRLGPFSTVVNLILFFSILAVLLAANLMTLLMIQDTSTVFSLADDEVIGCVLVVIVAVSLSWCLEILLRNVSPSPKLRKRFSFNGLQELKKENIALETSYKVDDSALDDTIIENFGAKAVDDDRSTHRLRSGHSDAHISALQLAAEVSEDDKFFSSSKETKEIEHVDISNGCLLECSGVTDVDKEQFAKNLFQVLMTESQFSSPFFLAEHYAGILLSSTGLLFNQLTHDTRVMEQCLHQLQHSLNHSMLFLVNSFPDNFQEHVQKSSPTNTSLTNTQTDTDSSHMIEYISVFDRLKHNIPYLGQTLDTRGSVTMWIDSCMTLQHIQRNAGCNITTHKSVEDRGRKTDSEETEDDSIFRTVRVALPLILTPKECWLISTDVSSKSVQLSRDATSVMACYSKPGSYGQGLLDACRKVSSDKMLLTHSLLKGLSLVMIRNSFCYVLEMSQIEMCWSQLDIQELRRHMKRRLSEMIYSFVWNVISLSGETGSVASIDEYTLTTEIIAAVITYGVLNRAVEVVKNQEHMKLVQHQAHIITQRVLEASVMYLQFEFQLDRTVKDLCESVIKTASDELLADYQDHLYVFSESVLKQSMLDLITQMGDDVLEKTHHDLKLTSELQILQEASTGWVSELDELPMSPDVLLAQSLILKFKLERLSLCDFFKSLSEYNESEWEVRKLCLSQAKTLVKHILNMVQKEMFMTHGQHKKGTVASVRNKLDIHLLQGICVYVEKIQLSSQVVLQKVFQQLLARAIVEKATKDAKLSYKTECQGQYSQFGQSNQGNESVSKSSEILELAQDLKSIRQYLQYVKIGNKQRNDKELRDHLKRTARIHKELVSINLQNKLDSFYVTDALPREYTEEELYVVEWFVSGDLRNVLPFWIKPVLIVLMLVFTLGAMVYFIMIGAQLTTTQAQEWSCMFLISCTLFGFVFEPLKVLLVMACMKD
ncbi:uncharacterized protein LOC124143004 [Haliotis rufescens]|uniref:uncharacterized protein LOC124143004 n=1 Tax=Haliotis rufescens TaxID=6454 RepID=UPI001EAFEF50|nr:uncharacterized protein LOC124143004 [Haliotis rufescens]